MKIGIDIRTLMDKHYSGVSEYTYNLVKEIFKLDRKNNYKLFYNSGRDVSGTIPKFEYPNVEIIKLNYPNKIFNYLMQKSLHYPKIDKILDVDLFFMPHINFISLSSGSRRLITVHDLSFLKYKEFFSFRKNFWHKLINVKSLLKKSDLIVAVSQNTKQDIVGLSGIEEPKIKVVYSGIGKEYKKMDPSGPRLEEARKKYKLPQKFILYLGTLEPRKNVSGIIKAFSRIKENIKNEPKQDRLKLVIAGAKGWKSKEVFTDAVKSKHKKDIIFLGYIDRSDKASLYNLADIFVYPSFYEGFGFPPLEAMACGCPTIVGANSSLFEISGGAALTVNPYNITEIANAALELLGNNGLKELLTLKGSEVARNFTWEKCARQYLDIFERL